MVNVWVDIPWTHMTHGTPPSYVSFPSHSDQGGDSSPSQKRTRLHTVSMGGNGRFCEGSWFHYRGSLDLQYPNFCWQMLMDFFV